MAFDAGTQQENVLIRYCERPDGGVVVWIRLAGPSTEVGPIELTQSEAAELGAHIENATRVLWAAQTRAGGAPVSAEGSAERPRASRSAKLRLV